MSHIPIEQLLLSSEVGSFVRVGSRLAKIPQRQGGGFLWCHITPTHASASARAATSPNLSCTTSASSICWARQVAQRLAVSWDLQTKVILSGICSCDVTPSCPAKVPVQASLVLRQDVLLNACLTAAPVCGRMLCYCPEKQVMQLANLCQDHDLGHLVGVLRVVPSRPSRPSRSVETRAGKVKARARPSEHQKISSGEGVVETSQPRRVVAETLGTVELRLASLRDWLLPAPKASPFPSTASKGQNRSPV